MQGALDAISTQRIRSYRTIAPAAAEETYQARRLQRKLNEP